MRRIKYTEIKRVRSDMLTEQNNLCLLCQQVIEPGKEVLDHLHSTGEIRGVLHRGCNALLGKIENNFKRNGLTEEALSVLLQNVQEYRVRQSGLQHPTKKKR